MAARRDGRRQLRLGIGAAMTLALMGLAGSVCPDDATAHIGDAFLSAPGLSGSWKSGVYRNWVKIEGHYWKSDEGGLFDFGRRASLKQSRTLFLGPGAPRSGADRLVISVDKRTPGLASLMAQCRSGAAIPEVTFAESSYDRRGLRELGDRPATVPAFYEYRLRGVRLSECPVVANAPEQAFVLSFTDIEWTNFPQKEGEQIDLRPASLVAESLPGATKTFVLSWFAVANHVSDDQCPKMNVKPTEKDFYALLTPQQAQAARAEMASKGGVGYESGDMSRRGPNRLNACLLPGIVPDPGHVYPVSRIAHGFDLDGNDGSGRAAAGTCKHPNYASRDGRTGIDNQLFTVQGCMAGYQGPKGFLMQYRNEQMRNGLLSILIQIRGIDNERNDDHIELLVLYSKDPMAKSADGKRILHDYTYRLTDDVEYDHYSARLTGRIVNGVVLTSPVKKFRMNAALSPELTLFEARMRIELLPTGEIKGLLGGYEEWRKVMAANAGSNSENLYGFQCPGLYAALRRNADGMKDPVTGECMGISSA